MNRKSVSCVLTSFNKKLDVQCNLRALRYQTYAPAEVIVVDNHSADGTADMIKAEFPEVRLIEMPHSSFGACETFNLGFKAASSEFIAIMDDDVVAPPDWLERVMQRFAQEPASTAMISSKAVEPGMPQAFIAAESHERYMATFRGCGTVVRREVLMRAGMYDEKFFIYGNERDLAARVLNLGYRILQYPRATLFHGTPFGMKAGKRSLYYHVRNFWLYAFKNCAWWDVLHVGCALGLRGLGLVKSKPSTDAVGTIGLNETIKRTPGGKQIALRATIDAIKLLPHCLRHRQVCRAPDFTPPLR
ncbi:MAG: glycosyltransferase family 2 protein [Planctomycetota bacterium]